MDQAISTVVVGVSAARNVGFAGGAKALEEVLQNANRQRNPMNGFEKFIVLPFDYMLNRHP